MTIFVPIFLLTFLATVTLAIRSAYLLVTRRTASARKTCLLLGSIIGAYATALLAVGLGSQKEILPIGATKCFDDWCVRVNSADKTGNLLSIQLDTINHGRRAQAPDSPHAFILADGRAIAVGIPHLTDKIDGGSTNPSHLTVNVPDDARNLSFLITEGGWPSKLVIGDENSPFHVKTAWPFTN